LTDYVAHRPAFLYFLVRSNSDGVDLGILRTVRRWNRWLLIKGYILGKDAEKLNNESAIALVRDCLGLPDLAVAIQTIDPWSLNAMHATRYHKGRVFCAGDAVHRHVPSNGLGSNTSIQDSYNLAWKLALVLRGIAHPSLLDSYEDERVPVGQQIVERATKSLHSYGPIVDALGLSGATPEQGIANMESLKSATPEGAARREKLRKAVAGKDYEFNAHGVEMNQRYRSSAVIADGAQTVHENIDAELFCIPTTAPGARLPHAWLQKDGRPISTLDLVGKGRFSVLTGIGGDVWIDAATKISQRFDLPISASSIGAGCAFTDLYAEWNALREIEESGCLLVRPDGYIAWRAHKAPHRKEDAIEALSNALGQILGRLAPGRPVIVQENIGDQVEVAQQS
jgi:2,4-dichlorophenol 6-monooxygenase